MKSLLYVITIVALSSSIFAQQSIRIDGFVHLLDGYSKTPIGGQVQRSMVKLRLNNAQYGAVVNFDLAGPRLLHNAFIWFGLPPFGFVNSFKISFGKTIPIFGNNYPLYPSEIILINFNPSASKMLTVRDVGLSAQWETPWVKGICSITNGTDTRLVNGGDNNNSRDISLRLVKKFWFFSVAASARFADADFAKRLIGADIEVAYDSLKIISEIILSNIAGFPVLGQTNALMLNAGNKESVGLNVMGVYSFSPCEFIADFDHYHSVVSTEQTYTFGINYHLSKQVRFAVNCIQVENKTTGIERKVLSQLEYKISI
ncbi:MAG: hypothetical protein V1707_00685 [bacterium]